MFSYSSLMFEKDQLGEFLPDLWTSELLVVSGFGDLQYEMINNIIYEVYNYMHTNHFT